MSIIALGFTLLCPNLPEITLQVFFRRLVFNSGEEQIPDPINPVERSPCREQKDSWPKQFRRFQNFKESPLQWANLGVSLIFSLKQRLRPLGYCAALSSISKLRSRELQLCRILRGGIILKKRRIEKDLRKCSAKKFKKTVFLEKKFGAKFFFLSF